MIIRHTSIIECFCDSCGAGQLKTLLDTGFASNKSSREMKGETLACAKCGHQNIVEEVYTCIPNEFLWFGADDLAKMKGKSDQSVKNFLEE
jgi:hypothetical protein